MEIYWLEKMVQRPRFFSPFIDSDSIHQPLVYLSLSNIYILPFCCFNIYLDLLFLLFDFSNFFSNFPILQLYLDYSCLFFNITWLACSLVWLFWLLVFTKFFLLYLYNNQTELFTLYVFLQENPSGNENKSDISHIFIIFFLNEN